MTVHTCWLMFAFDFYRNCRLIVSNCQISFKTNAIMFSREPINQTQANVRSPVWFICSIVNGVPRMIIISSHDAFITHNCAPLFSCITSITIRLMWKFLCVFTFSEFICIRFNVLFLLTHVVVAHHSQPYLFRDHCLWAGRLIVHGCCDQFAHQPHDDFFVSA